jgi:hypothetical protein
MNKSKHLPFKVKLTLHAAGPVRARTKHKDHKILRADGCITLPFAPFPGLYLTMEKPRKRSEPLNLYLRVRTVEWVLLANQFVCVVDEMLGSNVFLETMEVREPPRIELHFEQLERSLKIFGFEVQTDVTTYMALDRYADGSLIAPPAWPPPAQTQRPFRRRGF